jgi:hypothetical protein
MTATAPSWWVVDEDDRVISGPYKDRTLASAANPTTRADWGERGELREAYGVWHADGTLERRPSPADRAWEAHLSEQLDRLSGHGPAGTSADLAREVATALVESGFALHDCTGRAVDSAVGGVCVTPVTGTGAGAPRVSVVWTQHDRMATQRTRGADAYEAVQATMSTALAEVLAALGLEVVRDDAAGVQVVGGAATGA